MVLQRFENNSTSLEKNIHIFFSTHKEPDMNTIADVAGGVGSAQCLILTKIQRLTGCVDRWRSKEGLAVQQATSPRGQRQNPSPKRWKQKGPTNTGKQGSTVQHRLKDKTQVKLIKVGLIKIIKVEEKKPNKHRKCEAQGYNLQNKTGRKLETQQFFFIYFK